MIDLTLSDSEDELIGIGAGNSQQQQHKAASPRQRPAPAAAGSDSDDDKPLHQIKAELLQQHHPPQQQQQQQGSQQQQQQQTQTQLAQEQQRRPPRRLVSKKAAAAAGASTQPAPPAASSPAAPSQPPAAATVGKENAGPDAAAAAAVPPGDSSRVPSRPVSGSHVRPRAAAAGLVTLNFDDDAAAAAAADMPDWMTGRGVACYPQQRQQRVFGEAEEADGDDDVLPLHKRLRTDHQQKQGVVATGGRRSPVAAAAAPAAAAAGGRRSPVAAAAARGGVTLDDDDEVLCWEPDSNTAAAAAAAMSPPAATAAAGAGRRSRRRVVCSVFDAPGDDDSPGSERGEGLGGCGGLGQLGPGDCMWEPGTQEVDAAHSSGTDSDGGTAAAAAGGGSRGWAGVGEGSEGEEEEWEGDGGSSRQKAAGARGKQQQGGSGAASSRPAAAAAAAPTAGGSSGSGRGVRVSAEERAAERTRKAADKAAEKERKAADKIAAKLAKQAGVQAAKDAKRLDAFLNRKGHGKFGEYEVVVCMDEPTAGSALGLAISAELERQRKTAWQVVPRLPLSGRWPGVSCFCFKRRKLCCADEHALKTAVAARVSVFREDVGGSPPYVQLVWEAPGPFLAQLSGDGLAGLLGAVRGAHPPGCTLGLVVLGLRAHVRRVETQGLRAGSGGAAGGAAAAAGGLDWRRTQQLLLRLHLTTPGLQLRVLAKLEEAAAHVLHTARALGQQPYTAESQLEAFGGAGPSAASRAAAGAMSATLGPTTASFAVRTLGKMHGMGPGKAWAIAERYPSFGALIAGFERAQATPGVSPALLLQDLREPQGGSTAAAAGAKPPRRVGPTMSKRLHLLLTCEDPDTIVEAAGEAAE